MAESRKDSPKCRLCGRLHPLRLCTAFRAMDAHDRYECARLHKYCVNCLATSHSTGACDSEDSCHRCGLGHHTLLHREKRGTTRQKKGSVRAELHSRSAQQRARRLRRLIAEARNIMDKLERELLHLAPRQAGRHVGDMSP
ncbi:PREDICTED: uncharacterized protein LOC108358386 [Rhagoletis zephyria]|uniref:uncharacterized protein LOC108358386 n=1 Tax=Rhagoletis zephyria TaxID=28612 RepID=UPI0008117486|nr:PREDICTED: uncharacterized protein LOC108358386 [Rhagoletis zephyria]XP_036346462.1 uncharacterized protein LOC118755746 [Rhagoletis pomonella]